MHYRASLGVPGTLILLNKLTLWYPHFSKVNAQTVNIVGHALFINIVFGLYRHYEIIVLR